MGTNVATNFPPQTYSSQFFLNTLCDEVGATATASKKQSKNSTDRAESSNAVLDCFISTMHKKFSNFSHLLIMVLFLQISLSTAQKKYICQDGSHTTIRTFDSILELQQNNIQFAANHNYVAIGTVTISHLKSNDFIAYDSNLIRKLILNDKRIELIDIGSFRELYCVKFLLLQDNLISKINNGTFEGLYSLQELHLNGNNIIEIPNGSFRNLKHLLRLDLSQNKIKYLFDNSFQYLKSLWELHLEYNQISDIPQSLFSFSTHLHHLHLGNNKIVIPSAVEYSNLSSLDILDLQNNQIHALGYQALLALAKLSELNLYGNQLTELNITDLPSALDRINLGHNYFQCSYLSNLLSQLETKNVGIIIHDNTEHINVDANKIGCYNGTVPVIPLPTTSSEKPWFTKPSRVSTPANRIIIPTTESMKPTTVGTPDEEEELLRMKQEHLGLFKAVTDLTTVVVIMIILIVMFHMIDIMIRTNSFERCKRRFQRREHPVIHFRSGFGAGYSDSSFPLLQR